MSLAVPAVTATVDGPVVKRQRLAVQVHGQPAAQLPARSRIFAPFRTIGLVSPTNVPFAAIPLGKTTFQVNTSVGRALHTYDLKRGLSLVFITRPQTPEQITATTTWADRVLAAWGGRGAGAARGVFVFKRGKKVAELSMPPSATENVTQLTMLGSWIVGCCSTRMEVWKSATLEHYTTLIAPYTQSGSQGNKISGGICTAPTYLNKVLAGRQDGRVEIWNVSTGKLLYTILPSSSAYGAVTALQATPALSLVAIAYQSGPVVIHDIRTDKTALTLNRGEAQKTSITSISFRTDGLGAGEDGQASGIMATASIKAGDVTFWDLNDGGRKMGVLRGAHSPPSENRHGSSGGISKVEFLAGQAVLLTSGLDNSLKSWIFDEAPFSPIPRTLHTRGGHAAPVSILEFLPTDADGGDASGKWLMSAGHDRSLWGWSLRRDGQSTELSQGNIRKKAKNKGILGNGLASLDSNLSLEDLKAPKITCIACSLNRDGGMGAMPGKTSIWGGATKGKGATDTTDSSSTGWESVITGHEGDRFARTWFWGRKRAGRWAFETKDGAEVTSVAMSPCGTFALVGSAIGGIDMYNLQSGLYRQRFPARVTPEQARKLKLQHLEEEDEGRPAHKGNKYARGVGKHTKAVTGLMVDSLNRTVVSCGEDGKIKFWQFANGLLLEEIDWYPQTTLTGLRFYRSSELIALSCDDTCIRVVDITTRKLVRELWGCKGGITDYTFSNDGRWIVAASADSIMRVWDLPTGHLIDAMRFRSKCISLAFSNTGEHLATAHEDNVGVHIWTNRSLFSHIPTRQISDSEIAVIEAPTASGEGGEGVLSAAYDELDEESAETGTNESAFSSAIKQLSEDIVTLSLVPKSRWQNLLHLDLIQQRNKPKEAPKAPEKAPFFLPSLENGVYKTENTSSSAVEHTSASETSSRVRKIDSVVSTSSFDTLLSEYAFHENHEPLIVHLSSLPPSAADLAIRSLSSTPPYSHLTSFVRALTQRLKERQDFEVVNAWMAVFLRLFGDLALEEDAEELRNQIRAWKEAIELEESRLGTLVGFALGTVGWVRSSR